MPVHMWWLNAGVAPIYREYGLAIELRSASRSVVIRIPADLKKWLPGDAVVDRSLYVPDGLASGPYSFRVAILDPVTSQPAIRLGIQGRQADGWYDMGSVMITEQ